MTFGEKFVCSPLNIRKDSFHYPSPLGVREDHHDLCWLGVYSDVTKFFEFVGREPDAHVSSSSISCSGLHVPAVNSYQMKVPPKSKITNDFTGKQTYARQLKGSWPKALARIDRPPMSGPGSMLVQGWPGRHG